MATDKQMTREQLLDEAENRAYRYEQEYRVCSQCSLLTVMELFEIKADDAVKAATGFAGGMGRTGSACGAFTGGVMALSLLYGRDLQTMTHSDPDRRFKGREKLELKLGQLIKRLRARFEEEFGSILCDDIEKKIFGRSFDKWDPADREEKERLGGHQNKCPMVVGKGTRWVVELILDEKAPAD
jgi:C_GCAxxG_C_C family probable redox protein